MGCSFDCVYCYINGSKYAKKTNSYYVKSNACDLVYNKLKKLARNHERAFLNFGSASDPYMEIENEAFSHTSLHPGHHNESGGYKYHTAHGQIFFLLKIPSLKVSLTGIASKNL